MCVISRRNTAELSDLISFARERGVFVLFQPYHANKTGDEKPVPAIGDVQIQQLLSLNGLSGIVLNSRSYLRGLECDRKQATHPRCHAGHKYFSVDPSGYLHPCVDMPRVGHIIEDDITVLRSRAAQEMVSGCRGCWYCFRGEADTSLSLAGCLEKARLGLAVFRHNAALRK